MTVTVAPSIFFIFKDKLLEKNYLQSRFKRHNNWQQLTSPQPVLEKGKAKLLITQNQVLYNDFWQTCLTLGRMLNNDEFAESTQIKSLTGPFKKTFALLQSLYEASEFELLKYITKHSTREYSI